MNKVVDQYNNKKFKKRKVYTRFKDNIWASDLAEMGLLSSKNNKYSLCVIDVFTKYAILMYKKSISYLILVI